MVNSVADSPLGQREAGKNWPAVSIPNDPAIMIQVSLQIGLPFSELFCNAARSTEKAGYSYTYSDNAWTDNKQFIIELFNNNIAPKEKKGNIAC
jgi:hypothetical protein